MDDKVSYLGFERYEIPIEECFEVGLLGEAFDVRERDSSLKLVIGFAIGRYGYQINVKKDAISSIVGKLAL